MAVAAVLSVRALWPGGAGAAAGCSVTDSGQTFKLSVTQAQNAAIEAAVAYGQGLPDHAVTVAVATSLQESGLRNLPYGDADSVGLFQQRPSQGWGTKAQLLDPVYATTAFYQALARVPGWQTMAVTEAAQAVQHSAAPDAYAAWAPEARAVAIALTGEIPAGLTCRFAAYRGAPPAAGALSAAAVQEFGRPVLAVAVPAATGWRAATWAEAHAAAYHLERIAFAGQQWTPSSGRWTAAGAAGSAGSSTAAGAVTVTAAGQ
ncbi:hypothetical protein K6U06_18735 [Acidiferrimicrobium sp. IK]|uniref:hypothetical protein n=1 Tax=Acidiferrimicrobium sp. IK TaxID=2871700 RepID=UPI0021CAFCC9|nr:hypothetical protein [Acidiferrimicrobium sp. IK]MCU4186411.1 hypothetical protein [Acidiferrimicrobium sp. IK]